MHSSAAMQYQIPIPEGPAFIDRLAGVIVDNAERKSINMITEHVNDVSNMVADVDTTRISLVKKGSIDRVTTTLAVKLGTKHRLQDIAKKGESYDDVISGLIMSNAKQASEISRYQALLQEHDVKEPNILEVSQIEKGVGGITLSNGAVIQFSYNLPSLPITDSYEMDIEITKFIATKAQEKEVEAMLEDSDQNLMLHLWMVGRIITMHFDPAFELPSRKRIIDPVYWKKVRGRIGLSDGSYRYDIMGPIMKYEDGMND